MNSASGVRVRFAPSPTGHLHIGGLRTAIFNLLFARHNNGSFLLRLEDTDLERSKPEYTDSILQALEWANIQPDEPLVIQSERLLEHQKVIARLLQEKKVYKCFCTPQEIAARSGVSPDADPEFSRYDGFCSHRLPENNDKPFVIRFLVPRNKPTIEFNDIIRGTVTFDVDQFDDFIIARSDGRPMYNFVVVVDDAFMRITHVIRGEDHISNTPKQIFLYQACGYTIPHFAHLPLILGASGQRLSKRDAATSVLDYKQSGYLPDALLNYLVRLGWSHKDQELFTREEMIRYFTLEAVGKKGAIFDMAKLGWVNSMYMKEKSGQQLLQEIKKLRPTFAAELSHWSEQQIITLLDLYKERNQTLIQLADELKMLYEASNPYSESDVAQWLTSQTQQNMLHVVDGLQSLEDFSVNAVQQHIKQISKTLNVPVAQLAQPIRIALVHKNAGPGVFELMAVLGKDVTVSRIKKFAAYVASNKPLRS